ncbi:F420H2 dehydrogenase subunit FpoF [Methanohalophilus halophilus]|uniref:4Fe-4S dicluster domain-containing protein n=1 Tax=Methanohalophilus halophilus TaxID=2177 RepID=A0A1L3Q2T9_9EURY|nr:F420H2 dehydrogenase subunit FpoF [Methanohalophilus halophilus]APH39111.1 F420H2 dehydrogenase [Methanohalophilus halophilus]RNI09834.1 4Fe-4S dicluster domain-containing protein [Methanohalophilus halophilus]SDW59005.1 Coenzyme F420-reducing hydrogenase, beta subunit [Methanohalophilus halophilus]
MVHPKILEVIDYDVCTACGACVSACPAGAIVMNKRAEVRDPDNLELYTKGAAPNVCEGCYTCGRICPVVDGYVEDEFANVRSFFGAKSNIEGQDGGVTTAIASKLLELGEVDCFVGITRNDNWETELEVFTDPEQIKRAKGTKYTYDSVLSALKDPFEQYDKIGVIGVPCQAHGARLISENVNDKIVVIIGLLCMESFYHDVMSEKIIKEIMELNPEDVVKFDFAKGKFWAYTKDGESHSVKIPQVGPHARNPCHHCCDYTSVSADISIGSVGAPDGWNSVMIRTDEGEKYFKMAEDELEIMEDPKPGIDLVKKLATMKHNNNSQHYLEVCEKFSFDECGIR